ncbi:MAG TPA: aminotransferase class V-fold PLP-dependent enzyme [Blastocatellia bacterium]|nr:aminotransferase class V-fold PLP-dependent enzyme [Blastocatellia bacterium]
MDIGQVRQQFPGLEDKVFLDAACVSLAPRVAVDEITKFLGDAAYCRERSATLHHIAMDDSVSKARTEAARLINANEDEIALVESTTHGLAVAANALPLAEGDRVIISDLEFMQVAIPWVQKGEQCGVKIDVVPNHNGEVRINDIERAIGPKTRLVAISSVQWTNGYRVDLQSLSTLCRDRGIWLVVDAIQQLGAMPIDVRKTPVDFLVCGGHKWLNSPFGTGLMYVNGAQSLRSILKPPIAGYLSVEEPEGGWGGYFQNPATTPVTKYAFTSSARRYELGGTTNYPGAIGLAASLGLINQLGPDRIAEHIFDLTERLVRGLATLGFELVTPLDPKNRSGIVTFSAGDQHENVKLMDRLLDRGILVSVRYTSGVGGIRVACHFYNSNQDVDALLNSL